MNPPFDRGRDCDHVRHALAFLKPGGVLVAIMSARAEYGEDQRHKALHRMRDGCEATHFNGRKWIELPHGSFTHDGDNVNTVLTANRKPGCEVQQETPVTTFPEAHCAHNPPRCSDSIGGLSRSLHP